MVIYIVGLLVENQRKLDPNFVTKIQALITTSPFYINMFKWVQSKKVIKEKKFGKNPI